MFGLVCVKKKSDPVNCCNGEKKIIAESCTHFIFTNILSYGEGQNPESYKVQKPGRG